ncbi:hypothetical protein CCM_03763 [Cordyceps militaris CM01]|uniref:Uncharacterized protein n=1 Tax=Cordyceps militaris (strain CM01) TaxID=983644 RepID=G3JGH3_CORMM|nr:uncharacterized protein CCM_03763 [Cordyceps militaris CM01]EGX92390.1 hypothetical protein CCM_03763 [Cordyceps militaris CM01]
MMAAPTAGWPGAIEERLGVESGDTLLLWFVPDAPLICGRAQVVLPQLLLHGSGAAWRQTWGPPVKTYVRISYDAMKKASVSNE